MATLQVRDANGATQYLDMGSGAGSSASPFGAVKQTFTGDGTNQFLSGSGTNLGAQSGINAMLSVGPGQWAETHAPAVNTAVTKSHALAASTRHVCTWLVITLANDSTGSVQTVITFNLRDGATGAGSILASFTLALPATAGDSRVLSLSGLCLIGTAGTAMTLEGGSTPGTHTAGSVAFGGFSVTG